MALVLTTLPLGLNSSTWTNASLMSASDVAQRTEAMTASTFVSLISSKLNEDDDPDFDGAKQIYIGSVLETLATKSWAETPLYDRFVKYYGSATFLDDYLRSAFDATGQFAGEYGGPGHKSRKGKWGWGLMSGARLEALKKGLQDQVLVMAALSTVAAAPKTTLSWELAYAYWVGDTPGASPLGRGNKRCQNYYTCDGPDGKRGTADANHKVRDAIQKGWDATQANPVDTDLTDEARMALEDAAMSIYYQAAERYGYMLDNDLAPISPKANAEHQGEGGAFWRVIEPLLAAKDPIISAWVTDMYTMTNMPTGREAHRYCVLKYLLATYPYGTIQPERRKDLDPYASDYGSLEAAKQIICYSGLQVAPLVSNGGLSPSRELVFAYNASAAVLKTIRPFGVAALSVDEAFAGAKTLYVGSMLQTLARKNWGTTTYKKFVSHYDSATFLDDYLLSALDGTGEFTGPYGNGEMVEAQTEAVKKGLQDQVLVMAALSSLEEEGSGTVASWQKMWAYWTGEDPGGAPWARANKRCKNYLTCGNFTSEKGTTARANSNLLLATVRATQALADGDGSVDVSTYVEAAKGNALIVYYQASLRYLHKIDADLAELTLRATADHHGEGNAFWRVVAPLLAEMQPTEAAVVTALYDMTYAPSGTYHFCPARQLLRLNLPAGMTSADFGNDPTHDVTVCTFPPPPPSTPPVQSPATEESVTSSSSDSGLATGAIIGIAVGGGAVLVILVCGVIFMMQKKTHHHAVSPK